MQREEKKLYLESKRFNILKAGKKGNADGVYEKNQVQSSSSAPTLVKKNDTVGSVLRDSSSWSNPSDTTHISQRKNVQFNPIDAMNPIGDQMGKTKEGRKELSLECLREEFRRLIIPLMQKVVKDNPPDLIAYCARYFEDLLALREGKNMISNCKPFDAYKEENMEGYQKETVQNLSSLPPLQMKDSFGPLQFENVSWNNDSYGSRTLKRRHILREEDNAIRDQADETGNVCNTGGNNSQNDIKALESEDVFRRRYRDSAKEKGENFSSNKNRSPKGEIFSTEMHFRSQSSNCRKKWLVPENIGKKVVSSPVSSSSESSSSDSDEFDASYVIFEDEEIIPLNLSLRDPNSNTPPVPHFQDSKESNDLKTNEQGSTDKELSIVEVENFSRSLFQTLRQNIQFAEIEIEEKLRQLSKIPNNCKTQMQPRKKRSITTFSFSGEYVSADKNPKEGEKEISRGSDSKNNKSRVKLEEHDAESQRNSNHMNVSSDDIQSTKYKNTESNINEGNKSRNGGFLKNQGLVNPSVSLDEEGVESPSISFVRPRKHERTRRLSDLNPRPNNMHVSTNLSVRSISIPPIMINPPSSLTSSGNSNISNIGEGDVIPQNQNECSIRIEADSSITLDPGRTTGLNETARIPSSRDNDRRNIHNTSKKGIEKRESKGKNDEQNNSTAFKENNSKGLKTENSDTKAPTERQLEKSQCAAAQEINYASEDSGPDGVKKNVFKKTLSDVDLERVKSSNLNPCAPVFSPNYSRFPRKAHQGRNVTENSEHEKIRENEAPISENTVITDTKNVPSWYYSRSQNGVQQKTLQNCRSESHDREIESLYENRGFDSFGMNGLENSNGGSRNPSETKMAEGDRPTPPDKCGSKDQEADGKCKQLQEELCLNSPCGDFVLSEENHQEPLQNGRAVENSNSSSSPESEDEKVREFEQISDEELNFACLSDSGSADSFSSEMSEEEFGEENYGN